MICIHKKLADSGPERQAVKLHRPSVQFQLSLKSPRMSRLETLRRQWHDWEEKLHCGSSQTGCYQECHHRKRRKSQQDQSHSDRRWRQPIPCREPMRKPRPHLQKVQWKLRLNAVLDHHKCSSSRMLLGFPWHLLNGLNAIGVHPITRQTRCL